MVSNEQEKGATEEAPKLNRLLSLDESRTYLKGGGERLSGLTMLVRKIDPKIFYDPPSPGFLSPALAYEHCFIKYVKCSECLEARCQDDVMG